MSRIISYLTFNGNCFDAMKFYQKCLGGELHIQLVGDSPEASTLPNAFHAHVLQAELRNGNIELIATDMVGDEGLKQGNTVSMMMVCKTKKEFNTYFKRLASGGTIIQPARKNFWGVWFGSLQDRYGNYWLLQCA
jgi:PhnB protein